jgi:hypothetical protein
MHRVDFANFTRHLCGKFALMPRVHFSSLFGTRAIARPFPAIFLLTLATVQARTGPVGTDRIGTNIESYRTIVPIKAVTANAAFRAVTAAGLRVETASSVGAAAVRNGAAGFVLSGRCYEQESSRDDEEKKGTSRMHDIEKKRKE